MTYGECSLIGIYIQNWIRDVILFRATDAEITHFENRLEPQIDRAINLAIDEYLRNSEK